MNVFVRLWRLSSTNEFFRLNWKSHGRFRIEKRFRNRIFSWNSGSHIYWKGIFTCSRRAYSLCVRGSINNLGRILEYSRSCWPTWASKILRIRQSINICEWRACHNVGNLDGNKMQGVIKVITHISFLVELCQICLLGSRVHTRRERVQDWNLYVLVAKLMLNLFTATG